MLNLCVHGLGLGTMSTHLQFNYDCEVAEQSLRQILLLHISGKCLLTVSSPFLTASFRPSLASFLLMSPFLTASAFPFLGLPNSHCRAIGIWGQTNLCCGGIYPGQQDGWQHPWSLSLDNSRIHSQLGQPNTFRYCQMSWDKGWGQIHLRVGITSLGLGIACFTNQQNKVILMAKDQGMVEPGAMVVLVFNYFPSWYGQLKPVFNVGIRKQWYGPDPHFASRQSIPSSILRVFIHRARQSNAQSADYSQERERGSLKNK